MGGSTHIPLEAEGSEDPVPAPSGISQRGLQGLKCTGQDDRPTRKKDAKPLTTEVRETFPRP